jgi:hypothetical protein
MTRSIFQGIVAGTVVLATVAVNAAVVNTIEPDDYAGVISGGPNVRLYTLRANAHGNGIAFHDVLAVSGGAWNPTGQAVFGYVPLAGELDYHWDNIGSFGGAWDCYTSQHCGAFRVFGAYFRRPVHAVTVLTTMRGEQAMDPVDLWAFSLQGQRFRQCRLYGVTNEVLETGVLPPPVYLNSPSRMTCGRVVEKKNCSGQPGNCDYVVEMHIRRLANEIGFVWFGGQLWQNTHANVDRLTYGFL